MPSASTSAPPREYVHRQYLLALAKANVLPRLMEDEVRMREMGIPAEEYGRLMRKEENHGMRGFDLVKGLLYRVDWREKELEEMVRKSVGVDRAERAGGRGGRGDRYGRVSATGPGAGLPGARGGEGGRAEGGRAEGAISNTPAVVSAAANRTPPTAAGNKNPITAAGNKNPITATANENPITSIVDLLASTYDIHLPGTAQPGTEHRILCPQCGGTSRAGF